jgi:N-acetylneuraminic acid mutarotase
MQDSRSGLCLVYRAGYIYAIGGAPRMNTCERYNINDDKWEPISNLVNPRVEASASVCMYDNYIIVIGGMSNPDTIERYSFQYDRWELLQLTLPYRFTNSGVFLQTNNKLAVFGGRYSDAVVVLEIESFTRESIGKVIEEVFRLYHVDTLEHKLVTYYPCAYLWKTDSICFINDKEHGIPDILDYSLRKLQTDSLSPIKEYKIVTRITNRAIEQNRLLTPEYIDMYY